MNATDKNEAPRISVCLPFPGFYDSILSAEIDSTEEYLAECMAEEPEREDLPAGVTREQIAEHLWDCVDNGACEKAIAEAYVGTLADMVNENERANDSPEIEFRFEEMTSPREYNFETDRIFATVALADMERMRDTVSPGTFAEVLRERFTSRSGFISFYSNDPEEWNAKPLAEWDHNETGALFVAWLADNLPDDSSGDESIDMRVYVRMMERGDSPFYNAVSEALDYTELRTRLENDNANA